MQQQQNTKHILINIYVCVHNKSTSWENEVLLLCKYNKPRTMTHQNHQTNGASLEDCHTNFYALVSVCMCKKLRCSIFVAQSASILPFPLDLGQWQMQHRAFQVGSWAPTRAAIDSCLSIISANGHWLSIIDCSSSLSLILSLSLFSPL